MAETQLDRAMRVIESLEDCVFELITTFVDNTGDLNRCSADTRKTLAAVFERKGLGVIVNQPENFDN